MMNKKINFIYLFLIIVLIFFIGLFIYQNNFVKAQQGGSQNILRYKSPTTTPPDAVIEPFGGTTIVGGGESVFKNEVETKGVISFPKELYSGIEPIIFHGSGAQFIGRNAYFKNDKWYYYQDGAAYGIMFGAGLESSTTTDEWAYMRFLAATPSNKDSVISFNDSFSISPYGNVKFYKNLIFNDGIALLQGNGNLNLNLNGGELVISQPFSGLSGITLKLASSSLNTWSNTPFLNFYDEKSGTKFGMRSDENGFYFGKWENNFNFNTYLTIFKDGNIDIRNFYSPIKTLHLNKFVEDGMIELKTYNNVSNLSIMNDLLLNQEYSQYREKRIPFCDINPLVNDCRNYLTYLLNDQYIEGYDFYVSIPIGANDCQNTTCKAYAKKYKSQKVDSNQERYYVNNGVISNFTMYFSTHPTEDEILNDINDYLNTSNMKRASCDNDINKNDCNSFFLENISNNFNSQLIDIFSTRVYYHPNTPSPLGGSGDYDGWYYVVVSYKPFNEKPIFLNMPQEVVERKINIEGELNVDRLKPKSLDLTEIYKDYVFDGEKFVKNGTKISCSGTNQILDHDTDVELYVDESKIKVKLSRTGSIIIKEVGELPYAHAFGDQILAVAWGYGTYTYPFLVKGQGRVITSVRGIGRSGTALYLTVYRYSGGSGNLEATCILGF